jgi:hypothetical protein
MDRRCADALSGIARRTSSPGRAINILSYLCERRLAARQSSRMRYWHRRSLKSDMRYPQALLLLSPQRRASATEPFCIRFEDIRLLATLSVAAHRLPQGSKGAIGTNCRFRHGSFCPGTARIGREAERPSLNAEKVTARTSHSTGSSSTPTWADVAAQFWRSLQGLPRCL